MECMGKEQAVISEKNREKPFRQDSEEKKKKKSSDF